MSSYFGFKIRYATVTHNLKYVYKSGHQIQTAVLLFGSAIAMLCYIYLYYMPPSLNVYWAMLHVRVLHATYVDILVHV